VARRSQRATNGLAGHGRSLTRRRLLVVGGAGAAFLAACGGGAKENTAGQPGEFAIATSTRQAETSQPKPGGTLNVRLSGNAPLDPHTNTAAIAHVLAGHTYARLLKIKTAADPSFASNYELEGDLAETIETAGDGTTVTIRLRPNAKWHDVAPVSGRAVDSEDVKFAIDRFRNEPRNQNRTVFGTAQSPLVTAVETPDARTVVFRLAKPYGPFRNMLANSNYLWIMPKEIGAGTVDPAKQAIGCGPFMLDKVEPDIAYRLKRHPGYYGTPMPYVENINLNVIAEEVQEVAQFQAGRLDVQTTIPAERVDELRRSNPKASILEFLPQTLYYLAMQQRNNNPLRDERIRQAAQTSIDRDGILALIWGGKGVWVSAIPANFGKWRVDPKSPDMGPGGKWYKHDPAESKKLLAAAGYPNGFPVKYVFTNNIYGERFNQAAEAVAGMLREGGFIPQIITQDYLREYAVAGTGTLFGNFEGMVFGTAPTFTDPHDYFFNQHYSKSVRNTAGVNDARLDALIEKQESTIEDEERIKQVKEIQRYLAERPYYGTVAVGAAYVGVQDWLKNYQRTNGNGVGAETYAKVWFDRG
jgi:peptide/nickel transport system substrate-binding protein